MAQFTIRNLEDSVHDKLRAMAQQRGLSLEELVRNILRQTTLRSASSPRMGSRLVRRFSRVGLKEEIPELRGQVVEPLEFES